MISEYKEILKKAEARANASREIFALIGENDFDAEVNKVLRKSADDEWDLAEGFLMEAYMAIKSHFNDGTHHIGEWFPVDVRTPDVANVIAKYKFGVGEAKYIDGKFVLCHDWKTELPEVTHWTYWPKFEE